MNFANYPRYFDNGYMVVFTVVVVVGCVAMEW